MSYKVLDVRQPIPDHCVFGPIETIYNLAAVHRTPGHEDEEYYETNVSGAVHVCHFATRHNVKRIVFTSSIAVYGPTEEPLTEEASPNPVSAYGRSKLFAERIHSLWHDQASDRYLRIVRPAVIFGPGERGNFTRLAEALRKRTFFYPGRKDTIKSLGFVEDLVESMLFSLNLEDRHFVYNFCHPDRFSIEDICNSFHRVAGYPLPWGKVPISLMLLAASIFEGVSFFSGNSSINRARIAKLVKSTNIEPKNITDAGFQNFTSLDEALRRWMTISRGRLAKFK